jgi:hypothetical protein
MASKNLCEKFNVSMGQAQTWALLSNFEAAALGLLTILHVGAFYILQYILISLSF